MITGYFQVSREPKSTPMEEYGKDILTEQYAISETIYIFIFLWNN